MKKLKRPELKLSELKMPAFLADLYYDLRDRRLLPVIALVLVAIVAVPILMGSDPEAVPAPPPKSAAALESGPEGAAKLTVVEATPGLRDYRKRLSDRTPANPFRQHYTGLPASAQVEATGSTSSGGSAGEASVVGVEEETVQETTEETVTSPGAGGGDGSPTRYELVIDVQIARTEETPNGGEKRGELEVRHDVPVLTQLPGKKTPVVTTMGANFQKERLVFLVSHQVKAITGEFSCITRGEVCELLEVGLGTMLEYVYEPSGARYAIKVTNANAIPVRKGRRKARSSRAASAQFYPGMPWKGHSFSK